MKPTKEIIELSKKLKELGYRQKIRKGVWYIEPKEVSITRKQRVCLYCFKFPSKRRDYIPIPSLEDGLLWLKKSGYAVDLINAFDTSFCKWTKWNTDGWTIVEADTPHEAVLKAMVKISENKKE